MSTRTRFRKHFLLFLALTAFGLAQLAWWVIFQVGEGARLRRTEDQLWSQQILTARQWAAVQQPSPAEFRERLKVFPDLELAPDNVTVQVTAAARKRLDHLAGKRVRMFVSEGAFFTLLVFAAAAYIYWTLHREVGFEKRQAMFLSATSHELKTPITSLRLYLDTLKDRDPPPEQRSEMVATMQNDVQRLADLIERLLQAQTLLDPARKPNLTQTDLAEETQLAARELENLLMLAGHRFQVRIEPDLWALADPQPWQMLVKNLIENASKYSPPQTEIDLTLERRAGKALLCVTDRGIGLERSELDRIFDRFYRVENEDTRRTRGTGLGLYLVREIAHSIGGRAWAESAGPGLGSRFCVEVPLTEDSGHA